MTLYSASKVNIFILNILINERKSDKFGSIWVAKAHGNRGKHRNFFVEHELFKLTVDN